MLSIQLSNDIVMYKPLSSFLRLFYVFNKDYVFSTHNLCLQPNCMNITIIRDILLAGGILLSEQGFYKLLRLVCYSYCFKMQETHELLSYCLLYRFYSQWAVILPRSIHSFTYTAVQHNLFNPDVFIVQMSLLCLTEGYTA